MVLESATRLKGCFACGSKRLESYQENRSSNDAKANYRKSPVAQHEYLQDLTAHRNSLVESARGMRSALSRDSLARTHWNWASEIRSRVSLMELGLGICP